MPAVGTSADLDRILALQPTPRRHGAIIDALTKRLSLPHCTQRLRPDQAQLLVQAYDNHGAVGRIGLGGGKTLVGMLLPVLLGSQRPLLLIPAAMKTPTFEEYSKYRKLGWRHTTVKVVSYQTLGRVSAEDFLATYKPDLIVADEAHNLANHTTAAVARRLYRYMHSNPDTVFVPMSATFMKRSLNDAAHLFDWALGDKSPLPRNRHVLADWCAAVDVIRNGASERYEPGALLDLCNAEEHKLPPLTAARTALGRRVREADGVCTTLEAFTDVPLQFKATPIDLPGAIHEAIDRLLGPDHKDPNGDAVENPLDQGRVANTLVCGFWGFWRPPPPKPWRAARSEFNDVVGRIIESHDTIDPDAVDTPYQVMQLLDPAYKQGTAPHLRKRLAEAWAAWSAVKDTYKYDVVYDWLSTESERAGVTGYAIDWLCKNPTGICWTPHVFWGQHIAEQASKRAGRDIPFFAGAETGDLRNPQDHRGAMVCSIHAHGTGKNFQYHWDRMLYPSVPATGTIMEQSLGRVHRPGQTKPVTAEFLFGHQRQLDQVYAAQADAALLEAFQGTPQKLLGLLLDTVSLTG